MGAALVTGRILFVGFCWGAAGSTWLARVLNSHEDVLCLHAPIMPRYDHLETADSLELIDTVVTRFSLGGTYPVVGFTHGIAVESYGALLEKYGARLRCFTLTRNPIARIRSAVAKYVSDAGHHRDDPRWRHEYAASYDLLRRGAAGPFPDDFDSLAFYKACTMVNSIVWERQQPFPLFRLEDLVARTADVQALLAHVSDGACRLEERVIEKLQRLVVRPHAASLESAEETYRSWRAEHRAAFHHLVTGPACELYRELGYELP
jgi:hypothetical protein